MADKPMMTADTPIDVHLPHAAPHWRKNAEWRDRLAHQATRKALDIPDDDMNITSYKSSGIGPLGAIGIALAAGLPSLLACLAMLYSMGGKQEVNPPLDSEYEVIHYDQNGNVIPVPHISQLKGEQ